MNSQKNKLFSFNRRKLNTITLVTEMDPATKQIFTHRPWERAAHKRNEPERNQIKRVS